MDRTLREDADAIIASSLKAVLPDEAVRRAPSATCFPWRYTNISDYRRQDETAFLI